MTIDTTPTVREATDRLLAGLRALRRDDGSWSGHLPSSAVSTGAAVIALATAAPVHGAHAIRDGVRWLLAEQGPDGGWGDVPGAQATLNATAIGVAALAVADPDGSRDAIDRARRCVEALGGEAAIADKERCTLKTVCEVFLVEAGLYDARRLAVLPYELVLLPRRLWNKLSFTIPGLMAWGLMQAHATDARRGRRALRGVASRRALAYLRDIHDHESGDPLRPGGIEESALMTSVVCFGLAKAGLADDIVTDYIDYLLATVRPDGSWPIDRDIEHSVTAYLTHALLEARVDEDLWRTLAWIRLGQRNRPFAATGAPAGGWGWSRPSGWPYVDDTACAVTALAHARPCVHDPAVAAGVAWLESMQNRNGSWGCFARNAPTTMDAPCAVMTAHALLAFAAVERGTTDPAVAAALRWIRSAQHPDGHWASIWFRGRTVGTARILEALRALDVDDPTTRLARRWLLDHQLEDGSWGDGSGAGPGSVEETSWAVLALVGSDEECDRAADAGVEWLISQQRPDGLFDPAVVGIYFLGLTYHCDHFANAYALAALARWSRHQPVAP